MEARIGNIRCKSCSAMTYTPHFDYRRSIFHNEVKPICSGVEIKCDCGKIHLFKGQWGYEDLSGTPTYRRKLGDPLCLQK